MYIWLGDDFNASSGIEAKRECSYQELLVTNAALLVHERRSAPAVAVSSSRDENEARSLEFFQLKSLAIFDDIFEDDSFWSITVLQLAQSESSIYHGLLALSSYHEGSHESFGLRQFNLAIRALLHPPIDSGPVSKEVQVISCLIFFHIEV